MCRFWVQGSRGCRFGVSGCGFRAAALWAGGLEFRVVGFRVSGSGFGA